MASDGATVAVALVSGAIGFAGGALTTVTAAVGNWRGRQRERRTEVRDALIELQRSMVALIRVLEMPQDVRMDRARENHFAIARFRLVAGAKGQVLTSLAVFTSSRLMGPQDEPDSSLGAFAVIAPAWFEGAGDSRIVKVFNASTGSEFTVQQLRDLPESAEDMQA